MNVERKNRIILFSALACFILLMSLLAILSPSASHDLLNRPSTFYSDKSGAKGLWMILKTFKPSVTQWRKPFAVVEGYSEITHDIDTLIVASPGRPLGPHETEALMQWVSEGGQLILSLETDWPISDQPLQRQNAWMESRQRDALNEEISKQDSDPESENLLERLGIHFAVEQAEQYESMEWSTLEEDLPVYKIKSKDKPEWDGEIEPFVVGENDKPLVIQQPMGQGRILVTGGSSTITNEAMTESDNAVWWTRICLGWRNGNVAFDEYHHGFSERKGITSLAGAFLITPWGWFTLQAMLAGGLFILLNQRRIGRIYEKPSTQKRETLKLLQARASMLEQAKPTRLSAQWIVHALALDLTGGGLMIPWKDWIEAQAAQAGSSELGAHWKQLIQQLAELEQSTSADELALKKLSQKAATILRYYRHEH